jgi:hypothetical protein
MSTPTNPPLPPLPWLVWSEPAPPTTRAARRKTGHHAAAPRRSAGIGAGALVLCGAAACGLLWQVAQPVPAEDPVVSAQAPVQAYVQAPSQAPAPMIAAAPLDTSKADGAGLIAPPAAITPKPAPPARMTKAASSPPMAASRTAASAPAEEMIAAETAPVAARPAAPADTLPASAARIAEFRAVMDESRDTARLVIRLASRQRPPRDASAQEQSAYRLRQQNAEAARGYREYLGALARAMRGSPSQAVTEQSLERARQTQAYLKTMLAASEASLR